MPRFNNRFIDAETYAFFKKIRMPYNQAHCQTVLFQYMNTSPDAIARSYNLSKEDLVRTVVRRRPGGGLTVNWGNGSFKQFEVGTVMNARIHETNGRLAFEIVFKPLDGKTEKLTGFVSDMPRNFGKHSSDMPLDIPGEHNFSTRDVAASLFDEKLPADKDAVKTRSSYTQSFGYIFTDPSGTAAPDATPFRARHTAEFPDALSWFALFGSYGRPWANSRGTNFWGNFGKSIQKLSEVGESVKPEEVYGPGAVGAKGKSLKQIERLPIIPIDSIDIHYYGGGIERHSRYIRKSNGDTIIERSSECKRLIKPHYSDSIFQKNKNYDMLKFD